jgi:hypothetical protein
MMENVFDALVPPWMMRSLRRRLLIFVRAVVCWSSPGIVVLVFNRQSGRSQATEQRYRLVLRSVVDLVPIGPVLVLAAVVVDEVELGAVGCVRE